MVGSSRFPNIIGINADSAGNFGTGNANPFTSRDFKTWLCGNDIDILAQHLSDVCFLTLINQVFNSMNTTRIYI